MTRLQTPVCDLLGIQRPIFQAGMSSYTTPELVAAVSNAGGLGIIGGHKSQFQAEYVQALKKMGGKSLRAAPMVGAAGTPSGEAFAYKGKQSWVFVSVSYSSMPSGNYTVMLDDAEGSHVVGTIKVADGHGVLGAQAPGSAGTANGVRLVNGDGQLLCEALFTS